MNEKAKTMVYIGPTMKHVAREGSAYRGGYTPKFEQKIKDNPILKELIVPVTELAEARKEMRTAGSRLEALYKKVKEDLGNGRINHGKIQPLIQCRPQRRTRYRSYGAHHQSTSQRTQNRQSTDRSW